MKKIILTLFLVLSLCGPLLSDSPPGAPARNLVSRMMDAREGFRPPAKMMRYIVDAEPGDVSWPFDIARIEGMLENVLDRAADGTYRFKRESAGAGGSPRSRSAAALAYVNKVISDWAVMQLDPKFDRCDEQTVRNLAGYRVDLDPDFWRKFAILTKKGFFGGEGTMAGGWVSAWKITDRVYLVLTSDSGSEGHPCDYQFVMWNGAKDWPIAGFNTFPDATRVIAVVRAVKDSAAANNLAALIYARDANRRIYMPEYVEHLLHRAASAGCETAFYNLGILMEEQGNIEQAKVFFSRESR